jgi:hypothetical protein
MTLEATFVLTPRSSCFYSPSPYYAQLSIYGITLWPNYNFTYGLSFDNQHAEDKVYFSTHTAADPSFDYRSWFNRRSVPRVELEYNLSSFGAQKELALVLGFSVSRMARLLIFSNAAQLGDVTLAPGDNQFLMEIGSLATSLTLYFIHVNNPGSSSGGDWFFRGITGYVV